MKDKTQIPQNYEKQVNWVFGAYEDAGVGLANGFQKDSIQNSIGARPNKNWNNFKCEIKTIENRIGKFLIVEDSGTVGLTGENIGTDKILDLSNKSDYTFPSSERLSRFTSMNNSGDNSNGGGLYGVGKIVYAAASESYTYFFDSLTNEGKYVANSNEKGVVYKFAFEGTKAKEFIKEHTGLEPKNTIGTRVIIASPKEEIIKSIESGEIIKYIQESFWKTIEKMGDDGGIYVNDKKVQIPTWLKKYTISTEQKNFLIESGYRVKNFGLYLFRNGGNEWQGISYYRKGMKIGEIDIIDHPEKAEGKYFGFIEVDEPWEMELENIEDKVHFGVSKYKKNYKAYQNLKSYANDAFRKFMIKQGYIKERKDDDSELNRELNEMARDILENLISQGYEELGKGPKKSSFDVRWKDVEYPRKGSEEVFDGDVIRFSFRLSNTYLSNRKVKFSLYVKDPENSSIVSMIDSSNLTIKDNDFLDKKYTFNVNEDTCNRYKQNKIILSVQLQGNSRIIEKELPFYFDCKKPDKGREEVLLSLHTIELPREKKLRVNFGETIKNITYKIDNKVNDILKYKLSISVHDLTNSAASKIVDVKTFEGEIGPFETDITEAFDFQINEDDFKEHLEKGTIELRARLNVREDTKLYEKGTLATKYFYKLFLNTDEKNGAWGIPVESYNDLEHKELRSRVDMVGGRKIIINTGHPDYKFYFDDPKYHRAYCKNELEKQMLVLYLEEGKYSHFDSDFENMPPQDGAKTLLYKIEEAHYKGLGN